MITRSKRIILLVLCGALIACLLWWTLRSEESDSHPSSTYGNTSNSNKAGEEPVNTVAASSESTPVKVALEAIYDGLERVGAKRSLSAKQSIDDALKTKDARVIAQALNTLVYKSPWPRADVIEVLRALLTDNNPEIRLNAARYLYMIGDESGRSTVSEMMNADSPILIHSPAYSSGSYDLRFRAAEIAAKYRDSHTKADVLSLYQSTHSLSLLDDLTKVGVADAGQIIKAAMGDQLSYGLMELYGMANFRSEAQYITTIQRDEALDIRTRLAAAWANTQIGNDEGSGQFIRDFVESQIATPTVDLPLARKAVQYLGTLNDSASINLLERVAKQSKNADLVRVATANLVLNHSAQSSVGSELVIEEFTKKPASLGLELAVNLASVSSDPRLKQAGQSFDAKRDGERIWKQQGEGRMMWPLWTWADDFVISLSNK